MAEVNYYGTGRRKTSIARVWLRPGEGKISINNREADEYFPRQTWIVHALEPLDTTNTKGKFNVFISVKGGGLTGQAGAVRHGIARALLQVDESYRQSLKSAGQLRRDSRMVERKKYGLRKARRGQQFSKR
ncbi:MAG: 30S ribosomal protein S9 [Candidatus Dadabacteria bacterium]|nr:30S ribosomal protein S9 [Candidatus Dadabacteria bacterium]MCZ6791584.1 30S ribosomal protein S9 [Candidatus Dadabacteria bacterium]